MNPKTMAVLLMFVAPFVMFGIVYLFGWLLTLFAMLFSMSLSSARIVGIALSFLLSFLLISFIAQRKQKEIYYVFNEWISSGNNCIGIRYGNAIAAGDNKHSYDIKATKGTTLNIDSQVGYNSEPFNINGHTIFVNGNQ